MDIISALNEALKQPLNAREGYYEELGEFLMSPDEMLAYRYSAEFRGTNTDWRRSYVKARPTWGSIITNSKSLTQKQAPASLSDFYEHFKEVYKNNDNPNEFRYAGNMSWREYFIAQAERWIRDDSRANKSIKKAVTDIFIRIVIQSWEGMLAEQIVKEHIRSELFRLEAYAKIRPGSLMLKEPDAEMDHEFNCDILVYNKTAKRVEFGIQIKPPSYFNAHGNTKDDKLQNRRKDLRAEKEKGFRVYYIDKEKTDKGKICLIRSESVVEPYSDTYRDSPLRGMLKVIHMKNGKDFKRDIIPSPYGGF